MLVLSDLGNRTGVLSPNMWCSSRAADVGGRGVATPGDEQLSGFSDGQIAVSVSFYRPAWCRRQNSYLDVEIVRPFR